MQNDEKDDDDGNNNNNNSSHSPMQPIAGKKTGFICGIYTQGKPQTFALRLAIHHDPQYTHSDDDEKEVKKLKKKKTRTQRRNAKCTVKEEKENRMKNRTDCSSAHEHATQIQMHRICRHLMYKSTGTQSQRMYNTHIE